jgi:hypothetical protein
MPITLYLLLLSVEAMQALLKYKFLLNLNAQNQMSGATPLHSLMMMGKGTIPNLLKCMDLLLANGADPNIKDFWGKTPADYYDGNPNKRVLANKLKPQPLIFKAIDNVDVAVVQNVVTGDEYLRRPVEDLYGGKIPFVYALDLILSKEASKENLAGLAEITKLLFEALVDSTDYSFLAEACSGGGGGRDKPPIL